MTDQTIAGKILIKRECNRCGVMSPMHKMERFDLDDNEVYWLCEMCYAEALALLVQFVRGNYDPYPRPD